MAQLVEISRLGEPPPGAPWSLRRQELIATEPSRVWRALTDAAELVRWWCDRADVDLRPGGRYAFSGPHVYGGGAAHGADEGFEVLDVEPETHLELRWPLHGVETRVRYELSNHLEMTRLAVVQTAARAPGWDPGAGPSWWWLALPALRSHVEKGRPDLRVDYAREAGRGAISFQAGVTTFPWVIWAKLTSPRELARWWGTKAEVDLRPGGSFQLSLEDRRGPRSVLEVEEGRRLVHDWLWEGGARGTVEWGIEETDDDVLVTVTDRGPWDPGAPREGLVIYWASVILNLKHMSERGITPRDYQHA
ncbi:MAG: SRPBCC domain-containing protein [Planctomycetes bacterium]|nr:SRPBCC domain-containing protein [Planctomycetota bacterium]